MKPPVVILGATGQVGLFAAAGLLSAGHRVIAVTRTVPARTETAIDCLSRVDSAGLEKLLHSGASLGRGDSHVLLSCGPMQLALQLLDRDAQSARTTWERLVVIGTTSLESKQDSPDERERAQIEKIDRASKSIREICERRNIPLTVLNPTLIYGCGLDQNLTRVFRWIERGGIVPLARAAVGLRQPLHVADLAHTIAYAADTVPAPRLESAVCGGSILKYNEMIARLFAAAGREERIIRLPTWSFGLAAGLGRIAPGRGRISAEMFRRQSRDLVFDDQLARQELHHTPRAFHPSKADFHLPQDIERVCMALR